MRCPFCKDEKGSKVLDSREASQGFVIRRRRECLACERRFTTYERMEESALRVVKSDDTRQPFDRKKIFESLKVACAKIEGVSTERLEEVADAIEREIREVHDREVTSLFIRDVIMRELRKVDKVAYVRYASFYKPFQDMTEILDDLKPLLDVPENRPGG
jgi:transcriptional repressor NrdR